MLPLKLLEYPDGDFGLFMSVCLAPAADAVVEDLGHTPNGYFWQGVAEVLIAESGTLAALAAALEFDAEGDTFAARSADRSVLVALGDELSRLLAAPDALRTLIETAIADGFEFDD